MGTPTVAELTSQVFELRRLVLELMNTPRLHRKDLELRYGVSPRTIDRMQADRRLPQAIRFTGPVWRLVDIQEAELAGRLPKPKIGN